MLSNLFSGLSAVSAMDNFASALANIPKLFYFLYTCLASLVDLCQYAFRQLAGLETIYMDGVAVQGDLIYDFFIGIITGKYPILQTIFWSIMILGIIMLFIATILAFIKSESVVSSENKRGEKKVGNIKGKIIAKACMALVYMAVVPITCIFGAYIGNIVLQAVDGATSTSVTSNYLSQLTVSNSSDPNIQINAFKQNDAGTYYNYDIFGINLPAKNAPFSAMSFKAAAYNANRIRANSTFMGDNSNFASAVIFSPDTSNAVSGHFGVFNQAQNEEVCALTIDEAFANNAVLNNEYSGRRLDTAKGDMEGVWCNDSGFNFFKYRGEVTTFSKYNVGLVWYYYDLIQFNFIIAVVFIIALLRPFFFMVFGLIRRLIYLVALFLIAPAMLGTEPLGNGEMFSSWKKSFIENFVSVYGSVAAVNLMLILLPYFQKISFFPATNATYSFINLLTGLAIAVVAVSLIKEFTSFLTKITGGGDKALEDRGSDTYSGAKNLGTQAVSGIGKTAKGMAKMVAAPASAVKQLVKAKRDSQFKKDDRNEQMLKQEAESLEKNETEKQAQARQQLLQQQGDRLSQFDIDTSAQKDEAIQAKQAELSNIKATTSQTMSDRENDYVRKYMEKDMTKNFDKYRSDDDGTYSAKREEHFRKRYQELKGTQQFNNQVSTEANKNIENIKQKEIKKIDKQRELERANIVREQSKQIAEFERKSKESISNASQQQKQSLQEIVERRKKAQLKAENKEVRRARLAAAYKFTPIEGLRDVTSGLKQSAGIGKPSKDK